MASLRSAGLRPRHTRPKPVYHIEVSPDGKAWTRYMASQSAPKAKFLYEHALTIWDSGRTWVRIVREGSNRAVHLFSRAKWRV